MTQIIKYEEFQTEVLDSKEIVLVDFYATWCGPCQMLTPVIESLVLEFKDKEKIVKIDVDQSQDIATKYNVASIPTVILFKEGKVIDTIIGFRQKEDFINAINKA